MAPTEYNRNDNERSVGSIRAASTIALLAGIWLFVSPWVYGAYTHGSAWNSWIVGAVIVILAAIRLKSAVSATAPSWINFLLGIWTFFSPWIYGYTGNTGRFVNSLCVGVIVVIAGLVSANVSSHRPHQAAGRA